MTEKRVDAVLQRMKYFFKEREWIKKKRTILIITALAAVAVFFVSFFMKGDDGGIETLVIRPQPYTEKIVAAGQLQLARETTLISEVSGEIQRIGAGEGEVVSEGSIIISINDTDQDFQLEQKKANYENADAQYRHLIDIDYLTAKEDLAGRSAKKEQTKLSYEAALKLFEEGALSQVDFLKYRSDYETAAAEWNSARLKVESLGEGGALRNSSYAQLQSARSSYESALSNQEKYRITAPWNSVLLKLYVNEYDSVKPGDLLADIGEAGSYLVITELDEKYYPYLAEGMKAMISLDGGNDLEGAEGVVDVITPKINSETGTFEVKITLPEAFPYQASDLTVNVEIIIREQNQAIVIPEQFVEEGKSAVYLYQNGKAVETPIQYESGPSSSVVVTDGLAEGDIIIRPDADVKDGEAVKIREGAEAS
jgi:multidrug efflux pump subunit AcrA (membrane-fusion protein)